MKIAGKGMEVYRKLIKIGQEELGKLKAQKGFGDSSQDKKTCSDEN